MRYITSDGQKFDCELQALRHENELLEAKNYELKHRLNHAYGDALHEVHQNAHQVQAEKWRKILKQVFDKFEPDTVTMDTDSFFFIIPDDGEIIDGPCCCEKPPKKTATPVGYSKIPTWALVDELAKRDGVDEVDVDPETNMELVDIEGGAGKSIKGPARVLVVVD